MKAHIAARIASVRDRHNPQPVEVRSTERHFTPEEIAETWKVDVTTVRRTFDDVPGVLKLGTRCGRRPYVKLRIPESILNRIYAEMAK